jgi:hypothetical protein
MTKLNAIAEQAAIQLRNLVAEAHADILAAWDGCIAEAEAQETKPKLKLAFSITLDLDGGKACYDLSFGIRHKLTITAPIPDPSQATLPLDTSADAPTVTLKTDKGSVTAPLPVFRDAVRQMRAANRLKDGPPAKDFA